MMELSNFRSAIRADAIERAWENANSGRPDPFTYTTGIEDGIDAALEIMSEHVGRAVMALLESGVRE
jgi:hypothetical protein